MEKYYEIIDHTADLGIKVFGKDAKQLFANAGRALTEIITDTTMVNENITKEIVVDGADLEQLMVNWLHEVLYHFEVGALILKRFDILEITMNKLEDSPSSSNYSIKALGYGETFDINKHVVLTEIKAVTYHQIEVKKIDKEWQARIIFDL